jgi:hypothetical protein
VVIHISKAGTLPRVVERVRSNPKLAVAIACGVLLLLAWIAWAILVTSDHGSRAGLGVLVAWPALVAALAVVVLAFYGLYLLIRRLLPEEENSGARPAPQETEEAEASTKS